MAKLCCIDSGSVANRLIEQGYEYPYGQYSTFDPLTYSGVFFFCSVFYSFLQDSPYNLDPEKPELMDDFTAAMLKKEGKNFADLETEIVDAPFVQVSSTTRQTILPESFQ